MDPLENREGLWNEDKTQTFSLQNLETLPISPLPLAGAEGGRMGQVQDEQGVL